VAWTVTLETAPRKALRRLPEKVRERILRALILLETDPFAGDVKKLAGMEQTWRLRVGDYRIVYEIDKGRLVVLVIRIADRRDAYR
jgi:mRNA interferase RelE/StbE